MCEGKDGGGLKMRRVAQQVKGSDFQETFKPITGLLLQKKEKEASLRSWWFIFETCKHQKKCTAPTFLLPRAQIFEALCSPNGPSYRFLLLFRCPAFTVCKLLQRWWLSWSCGWSFISLIVLSPYVSSPSFFVDVLVETSLDGSVCCVFPELLDEFGLSRKPGKEGIIYSETGFSDCSFAGCTHFHKQVKGDKQQ